jgi:hypothetical protein
MKIQLDLKEKTIKVEESINLHEFFEYLNEMFPNGKWREFTLVFDRIKEWDEPITIPNRIPPFNPDNPWVQPYSPNIGNPTNPYDNIWYGTNTSVTTTNLDVSLKADGSRTVFNFEIK